MNRIGPADILAAGSPALAGWTIGELNAAAGFVATVLGIAYLIWKWRREAARPPSA